MTIYLLSDDYLGFPPVEEATEEGIVAVGGDLSINRLINAYINGIFPWYNEGEPIVWYSPDPRLVLRPEDIKISKSLRKTLKNNTFEVRFDTNFEQIIHCCAQTKRKGSQGTWITNDIIKSYTKLHEIGIAHSVEVYKNQELTGGLYGLSLGNVFFGESMFHTSTDASKVAFVHLCKFLHENEFQLIDAQQDTNHLRSLGAYTISRKQFLKLLEKHVFKPTLLGNWGDDSAKRIEVIKTI
ncbi:MAG: leucyl/phenylalanyl-tRNA--protein transferase [Lentimicrobiaceae bacterium]|nr:leucyl/phenylalanyl-tRNA--protein transferase [Lentimicrobiaceae bacterium]